MIIPIKVKGNFDLKWCKFDFSLVSVWGHPETGCADDSDKVKKFNSSNINNPCEGDEYTYYDLFDNDLKVRSVEWKWFPCTHTKKCVHSKNHCDLHPHPDCIYESEDGTIFSEDEEDCPLRKFFYNLQSSHSIHLYYDSFYQVS